MFQIRFGRKIRKARAPPNQIHLLARTRRCPVSSSPATMLNPSTAMEYFSSKPSPATAPNQSQCGEDNGKTPATEFSSDHGRHNHGSGGRHRRDEANTTKRVTQHKPADS